MNRKGTEKPIEIFVALFIILAVALVMLKLFQSQIAEKQKQLSDVQQEQVSKEQLQKVRQACSDKCVDASNQGCSLASLASLCTYGSVNVLGKDGFVDLNNDKSDNYDETLLAGVGVCEDHVYCFHVIDSCCSRQISAKTCKDQILTPYWQNTFGATVDVNSLLNANLNAGTCVKGTNAARWDKIAGWPAS